MTAYQDLPADAKVWIYQADRAFSDYEAITIQQKLDAFYGVRVTEEGALFVQPDGDAGAVCIAGDFNGWKPEAMRRQKDGSFVRIVPLDRGSYEYKFLMDGDWTPDPDHRDWALNPHGTVNSVAVFE